MEERKKEKKVGKEGEAEGESKVFRRKKRKVFSFTETRKMK